MASSRIPQVKEVTEAQDLAEKLQMSTAEIGLSVRTTNCLEDRGIFTVGDLLNCTREDLLGITNFGEKTLEEVYKALAGIGFHRKCKEPAAKKVVAAQATAVNGKYVRLSSLTSSGSLSGWKA